MAILLKMDPADLAIKQALKGDFLTACKTNEQILKQDPKNIDALNRLGQAYLQLGHLQKAKTVYCKALRLDRFNPIAKRNLEKIKDFPTKKLKQNQSLCKSKINFLEEPGKTKLVALLRLGETKNLVKLLTGQLLHFINRRKVICLYDNEKSYIGRLPDDLSRRLIWLIKRGNCYQAHVKSVEKKRILVFLKETKQAEKNHNYTSFPSEDDICSPLF